MRAFFRVHYIFLLLIITSCASSTEEKREILLNSSHHLWQEHAPPVFQVKIASTKGDFIIEVNRAWSPIGADRFYNLVRTGFFDDSRFFRIREGFIAQFGISGDPEVSAVWKDYEMKDDSVIASNLRGFISYAMTGPNTRTTQLYINYIDNVRLDDQGFSPIGKIISGMAVVDSLYADYGENAGGGMRGGKQQQMFEGGNVHLDKEYPLLDRLISASIIDP